jgi:hypothetical protein
MDVTSGVALVYGMLSMFVLSGAERNLKAARPNPRMLEMVGYVLCGFSATASLGLAGAAVMGHPVI